MHLIWSSKVKCVVTVWFLWSFWYILSNGVGDVTSRWRHFWFTSQHQSDLKYITHNSGSHYCFYYRSHQHTRTRNKNIYIAIKDYPQIRVWSYLPQVVHSFWERPTYMCTHTHTHTHTHTNPITSKQKMQCRWFRDICCYNNFTLKENLSVPLHFCTTAERRCSACWDFVHAALV